MLRLAGLSPPLAHSARAAACALLSQLSHVQLRQITHLQPTTPNTLNTRKNAALAAVQYLDLDAPAFHYAVLDAPLSRQSEELDSGGIPRHLLPFAQRLARLGGRRAAGKAATMEAAAAAARSGQPFAIFLGTGGTEAAALELTAWYHKEYRKAQEAAARKLSHTATSRLLSMVLPPTLLLAHPYANSLPSALEALARLQQDGLRGRAVYLPSDAPDSRQGEHGWVSLQAALQHVRVWHALHQARVGLLGAPSPWLVASTPPAQLVASAWGPTLVDVDMQELMEALQDKPSFRAAEVGALVADMLGSAASTAHTDSADGGSASCPACGSAAEPGPQDPASAAEVYLAMKRVVQAHRLSCVTVRCFDLVTAQHTSGCYSLSRLLDEGVIAGCEGDVCSALGMLWSHLLTGQVPWMANIAQVDPAGGVVKLAHCTIARCLLASAKATTHFESGLGVAIKGEVPPGAVTLLRIGGRRLDRLWVEEGYALGGGRGGAAGEWSPQLCRTQVRVSMLGGRSVVEDLLLRPLGNHVVLLRGHHRAALESYFRQVGPGTAHHSTY